MMTFDASLARKSARKRHEAWEEKRKVRLERVKASVRGYFEGKAVKSVYATGTLPISLADRGGGGSHSVKAKEAAYLLSYLDEEWTAVDRLQEKIQAVVRESRGRLVVR